MYNKFYHGTTRKMIVAFSSVFDNIEVNINNRDIIVPLHYAQSEKFIQKINQYKDENGTIKPISMPVMGFELTSMQYDPERHTNTLNKIQDVKMKSVKEYMYNRSPITWNFDLYIAVKRLGDGLQIIEQIIPFFTPHLNLTVRGVDSLNKPDNIQLTLTSFSHEINSDGDIEEPRNILFQLSFMMKGYLYTDVKRQHTIKESIINIEKYTDEEFNERFGRVVAKSIDGVNIETNIEDL